MYQQIHAIRGTIRGGSWGYVGPSWVSASGRSWYARSNRFYLVGLRLIQKTK